MRSKFFFFLNCFNLVSSAKQKLFLYEILSKFLKRKELKDGKFFDYLFVFGNDVNGGKEIEFVDERPVVPFRNEIFPQSFRI